MCRTSIMVNRHLFEANDNTACSNGSYSETKVMQDERDNLRDNLQYSALTLEAAMTLQGVVLFCYDVHAASLI